MDRVPLELARTPETDEEREKRRLEWEMLRLQHPRVYLGAMVLVASFGAFLVVAVVFEFLNV